jgi:hypothetical protein
MDDGLELALGIHAATNIYSALFVTFDESALPTAALFHLGSVDMDVMLIAFFVSAAVFVAIVSKKYKWKDWHKCFGQVNRPNLPAQFADESIES